MREQQARLDALEGLLRGTIAKDVAALRKEVDAVGARADAKPFASWAEKVKFKGDFRYRHEWIDDESARRERTRQRIRFRLGMEAHPSEDISVYARMVTGSEDPRSTNQTLDGAFSTKSFSLDRAYVDWHPSSIAGLHVLAGKMAYPLFTPMGSQLIFDSDLSVEGIAAAHSANVGETTQVFAGAGGFWVDESSSSEDLMLWACQLGLTQQITEDSKFTVGGTYLHYQNIQGRTTAFDPTTGFGNSTQTLTHTTTLDCTAGGDPVLCTEDTTLYTEDYRLLEAFCVFEMRAAGLPTFLYGDFVHNIRADSGKDIAWLVGCQVGKAKSPGSWQAAYDYRELEDDAVLGALTDADFNGGGTGGKGHRFSAAYQVNKAAQVAVTYFFTNDLDSSADKSDYRKLQLDFNVKF